MSHNQQYYKILSEFEEELDRLSEYIVLIPYPEFPDDFYANIDKSLLE